VYLALLLPATLAFGPLLYAESSGKSTAPSYSTDRIVNSATNMADALAPNAIASIYGTNLSYGVGGAAYSGNGYLPEFLAGVRVYVAGFPAGLYYVSPQQINFLIPSYLRPGDVDLFVGREGTAGPHVQITLHPVGPGFFQWGPGLIAATHADGRVITKLSPARAGETVVLYGTGLGSTDPAVVNGQVSMVPAQIVLLSDLRVLVAGTALDSASIFYAGVTPGIPGLYQINLKLPKPLAPDPEIRIVFGDQSSPAAMQLPVQ
jgi:uncharacterized protein (TIGR03437 family)